MKVDTVSPALYNSDITENKSQYPSKNVSFDMKPTEPFSIRTADESEIVLFIIN